MDLFGTKEHDARHDTVEQELRSLAEQLAQLTIELGEARADIYRLQVQLDTKIDAPDPDALDQDLADAKAKLGAAKVASGDAWNEIYPQLLTSLDKVRDAIDSAGKKEADG
jgi:predicted  nucleic acid-binding Zn-ribbon protein